MTQNQSFAGTQPAPDFPTGLEWLNTERPLSLDQLKGKVVLLDFWTYGCINCMHIIPDLSQLEEEYPDELVVIGVHSAKFENEGDTDNIRQIILRYGLEHPVVNDSDFIVWRTWGARAWPTLVLIDPAGNIVGGHSGENIYPIFQPIIDSLVREFDANGILDRTPLDLKLEKEGLPETVLSFPGKVLADEQGGRLFIADTNHHRIVVVDIESGEVLNVIGNGDAGLTDGDFRDASFTHPQGMALSPDGKILYLADTENHSIRLIDLDEEAVSTLLGTGEQGRVYPPLGGIGPKVALRSPWDLELHEGALYIAMAGSHQIWSYDLVSRVAEPLIGNAFEGTKDGTFREAELAQPSGLALDGTGRLYFSDSEASSIRWGDIQGEEVFTLVGSGESLFEFGDVDGVGRDARLQHPLGVVVLGDTIFITDTYNHKIKNIDPDTSEITTFLGDEAGWRDGDQPLFYEPGGLDVAGDKLYIADTNNHAIRVVDLASLEVSTLVLKGIDRYMTSTDEAYSGDLVRFDPVIVQAGEGRVLLQVDLPEGYKVNDEAPSSIDWNVEGDVVELPIDANITQAGILFPVELEVSFQEGQGMLISDLSIIYCESEKESLCLIEQVRLEVPISASPSGENFIELLYEIPAPKLNSRQ
ncbi:MAG: redoxin domain-containing protein [Anaerolineales bacterium]|nr:redoxin domain-containing protein [Anaerolineales bacterium]